MVNTKNSIQMPVHGQLLENPPQQNQEQLQHQRQPDDILRRIEEWEHRINLQRQEDIRIIMQEHRHNASLRRKGIQRMRLVEERLGRIENPIPNKNRNESNPIQVNASGSLQVNARSRVRIELGGHENQQRVPSNDFECAECSSSSSSSGPETEKVKSSIKKEEPLQVKCEICAETKRITEMIKNQTCRHSYCSDCMTKHVATKIQDIITAVPCPGLDCKSVFELETCRPWLPKDLVERWDKALCEALFLQVHKFYCPFKDCSAMMLVENEEDQQAGETECPVCHRMVCARCSIPWHIGINCEEYQKQKENERQREDLLMRKLAKEKRWRRCPKCNVEKISGCVHISCRCKYEFCYDCGQQWCFSHTHPSHGGN